MSSSFKQKKMKTLATRKKTRKRKMQLGMTHEDESGRLFQPPSLRDPRWKKPSADAIIAAVQQRKKRRVEEEADDDDDDDGFEIVANDAQSDEDAAASDKDEDDDGEDDEEEEDVEEELVKSDLMGCATADACIKQAMKRYREIRRQDGRQKAKVLFMVDNQSLFKQLKTALNVKTELVKTKSKLGVRSGGDKKAQLAYKNAGLLKTPMDKFSTKNEDPIKDYKNGKLPTLMTEDLSFFPYLDLPVQHLFFLAKAAPSAINFDQSIVSDVTFHAFVVQESMTDEHKQRLNDLFNYTDAPKPQQK